MAKVWLALILSFTTVACATNPSMDGTPPGSSPPEVSSNTDKKKAGNAEKLGILCDLISRGETQQIDLTRFRSPTNRYFYSSPSRLINCFFYR